MSSITDSLISSLAEFLRGSSIFAVAWFTIVLIVSISTSDSKCRTGIVHFCFTIRYFVTFAMTVTTHDALIQFWRSPHPLSRLLNLFSMLLQCGINLWSYLINLPISAEVFLLYYLLFLNKIPARNLYDHKLRSDEPRLNKRCLFRRGYCLFFV